MWHLRRVDDKTSSSSSSSHKHLPHLVGLVSLNLVILWFSWRGIVRNTAAAAAATTTLAQSPTSAVVRPSSSSNSTNTTTTTTSSQGNNESVVDKQEQQRHEQPWTDHFPDYGTLAFQRKCPWAVVEHNPTNQSSSSTSLSTTLYVTTNPNSHEGIAQWVSDIVQAFMYVRQASSSNMKTVHIRLDYGPHVDLTQIWSPVTYNWNHPNDDALQTVTINFTSRGLANLANATLVPVPTYRHASKRSSRHKINTTNYNSLKTVLPGFNVQDGFACAMQSLIQLSPAAKQYLGGLEATVLPTLHNPTFLTLGIYIRSGQADQKANEERGLASGSGTKHAQTIAQGPIHCALQLEQQLWQAQQQGRFQHVQKVVWMVISDSAAQLEDWIMREYNNGTNRTVLFSQSQGRHSRPQRNPSTNDVAEGLLDWYLLGETNAVIMNSAWYSFGFTASLRTSRVVYEAGRFPGQCARVDWLV